MSGPEVGGYAVLWGDRGAGDLGAFVETHTRDEFGDQTAVGFRSTLGLPSPGFLVQHNAADPKLANVDSGTMSIEVTDQGLRYRVQIPEAAPLVAELIGSGVLGEASIGFSVIADEWGVREDGMPTRLIRSAWLWEISAVSDGALSGTSLEIIRRSVDLAVETPRILADARARIERDERERAGAAYVARIALDVRDRELAARMQRGGSGR